MKTDTNQGADRNPKTERTPEELLAYVRECWLRYRTYPMWPVIFERCRDQIIEVMSSKHTPVLATAAAIYAVGESEGAEGADCWLAVGWEMQVRMAARGVVGDQAGFDVGVDEPRLKAAPLAVLAARDGSVLLSEIGGTLAIDQNGRLAGL